MTRLLVTGGAGFIGRHLCRRLDEAGTQITVLDDLSSGDAAALPPGVRLIRADICDRSALAQAMAGVDGIIHLAAVSSVEACSQDRPGTRRVNLGGTQAVLAAAAGCPLVFTSSAAIYGDQPMLPVAETATPRPISPYAEDKLAAEAMLHDSQGPAVILRPFNVFGPGQSPTSPYSGVISRFVARAVAGESLRINGDGSQTRDFIHVSDVARALVAAIDRAPQRPGIETFNLCRGEAISVLDLACTIQDLAGSRAPTIFGPPRDGDIQDSLGDPSQAQSTLNCHAQVSMSDGLATLIPHA